MVEIEVAHQPEGYVLVRLAGEIDMSQEAAVRRALAAALAAGRAPVLVDLCSLRFLAVVGADWIDAAVAELADQGRAVAVVCTEAGSVRRIVALLGLDRRWPVHHDVARAVATLHRA
jgi:anti-sigma B factor antagonist